MRRFLSLLLLACLLLLPQATPEVAANTEPTIPAPLYEVPLPLILQLSPDPRIVCTPVTQGSSGDWYCLLRNTSDQDLYVYDNYSYIPIPYVPAGSEVPLSNPVGCQSFYTHPLDKPVVQMEIGVVTHHSMHYMVWYECPITNTSAYTVTVLAAGAADNGVVRRFPYIRNMNPLPPGGSTVVSSDRYGPYGNPFADSNITVFAIGLVD